MFLFSASTVIFNLENAGLKSISFIDGKSKMSAFTDDALLLEIYLYLYTRTVLPLGF